MPTYLAKNRSASTSLVALVGISMALAGTCCLAAEQSDRRMPADTAPMAPALTGRADDSAPANPYRPEATEAATSNLKRDLLQATGGQAPAIPSQVVEPDVVTQLPDAQAPIVQAVATETIPPERRTIQSEGSPGSGLPDSNPLHMPLGGDSRALAADRATSTGAFITVGSSLAIVLGLFFFVAWAMRKAAPKGSLILPGEIFEILGRASLGSRQQVQLVRCGNKLVLLSITPSGTEPLTEVTDPLEVDRIAGVCRQAHPRSSTKAFQQVFQQLAPRNGSPGPLDDMEQLKGRRSKPYRWESERD